jgi:phage shock protein C
MKKRLYKSKDNKVLAGVMGGLGEYFDVDPVIFRLGYLLVLVITAVLPGIIIYIIAALIIPDAPSAMVSRDDAPTV